MDEKSGIDRRDDSKTERLTERQREYVDAFKRLGSTRAVADEFAVTQQTVQVQLNQAAKNNGMQSLTEWLPKEMIARSKRSKTGKASASELMQLIDTQEYRCALSGVLLTPETSSLDHKTPISSGGSDAIDNLQWVSNEVNRAKGSMNQDAFIEMCRLVSQWSRFIWLFISQACRRYQERHSM